MEARIIMTHADNDGLPIIKLKGDWLKDAGFKDGDKIAVYIDRSGELIIVNMDTRIKKLMKEEESDLIIIE